MTDSDGKFRAGPLKKAEWQVKLTKEDLPMERPKNFQIPDWDDVKFDKNSKKMIYKIPSHRRPSDIAAPSELNSI